LVILSGMRSDVLRTVENVESVENVKRWKGETVELSPINNACPLFEKSLGQGKPEYSINIIMVHTIKKY
jgi:hypothetical protein